MEFTVDKPLYDTINKYYVLKIVSPPVFTTEGPETTKIVFEGELKARLDEFIDSFLEKASSYFSKPLDRAMFIQRIAHEYSTGEHELRNVSVQEVSWIPARILFYPNRYEIRWIISEFQVAPPPPGSILQEADIDTVSAEDPPRRMLPADSVSRIARKKIRQARMRIGFAKLALEKRIEKYYKKYGNFEGLDNADSELSSEEE